MSGGNDGVEGVRGAWVPYVVPLAAFGFFLVLLDVVRWGGARAGWGIDGTADPRFWIYPVQTAVCAVLLLVFWRRYEFRWRGRGAVLLGVAAGLLAFLLWVTPQEAFGVGRRLDGFDPGALCPWPAAYWSTLAARLVRLVLVVPLLEEVFWRGWLMRRLIAPRFDRLAFGTFEWRSFVGVAALFAAVHAPADWPAAFLTGLLYNALACVGRSLGACVVAHAATNLLLGIYILQTGQWGFW